MDGPTRLETASSAIDANRFLFPRGASARRVITLMKRSSGMLSARGQREFPK